MLLGFVSCSRGIVISENELKPGVFYAPMGLKPFTGICKIYYIQTDRIREEFRLKKGMLHGESRSYYPDGDIMWKGSYREGLMSGKWQKWDEHGHLIMELHYVDDVLEGPFVAMYTNGSVKEKGRYSGNRRVGEWIRTEETVQYSSQ